jgi:two-component system sensor kinase
LSKNKILSIDDEVNILETLSELLTLKNYEVKTTNSGQKALEIMTEWIPDLILCDIMMPDMDGHDFHKLVNENITLNRIPFIFLTAKNEITEMKDAMARGVDDFITKPFKIDELIHSIETRVNRFNTIKNTFNGFNTKINKHFLHEINTPLYGILGSVDLLIKNKDSLETSEIESFYESIKTSALRLNKTLQNIVFFQNIKNNLVEFSNNSSSEILNTLSKVIDKTIAIDSNNKKRIDVEVEKATINITESNLEFILFELLDNALKFSNENKNVIVLGKTHDENYYKLVILDFGNGFNPEDINNISPFNQFNRNEMEQQGLGLGLFISKKIIKKCKGQINIISKDKIGTEITILLPLSK